jgi:hypothetical protein
MPIPIRPASASGASDAEYCNWRAQEIALVHALDVGVTELALRRERFQR